MTHTLIRAALIVSVQFATPVFAQAVIDEPGNYAFFHPNADVLNPPWPGNAMAAQLPSDRNIGGLRLAVQPRHHVRAPSAKIY
ncbi:MAG TPA: hypothetical protein VKY22_16795 [Bradyrhizobium sp.]|nr:hypothetical protein [Bradyrhizobium sp.]